MERDQYLLEALKNSFNSIVNLPSTISSEEVRFLSAQHIQNAFHPLEPQIKGSENLPNEKGTIFIYNHLQNHPYFTVAEHFQITLDSHFISSFILNKYYKNPGIRVVRHSLPEEINHKRYYDKFDYIRVFTKNFTPRELQKNVIKKVNQQFYPLASEALENNKGLVFSPEGASYLTESSPGFFNKGIFKLACAMELQPLIVPIVMANFDKRASEAPYKCQIMPPFRMHDLVGMNPDSKALNMAIQSINQNYSGWVQELAKEDKNFSHEITVLKKNIEQKQNMDDLMVFYGSSTIRLWKNLAKDFPDKNTLNLGFGGAFISSLNHYFEDLFGSITPRYMVLYLGGNDLTRNDNAQEIVSQILAFIERVHTKFPNAKIYNISIKPSMERAHELEKIKAINFQLQQVAEERPYLIQIDIYNRLIQQHRIREDYFLQDGLHLNYKGYEVLSTALTERL